MIIIIQFNAGNLNTYIRIVYFLYFGIYIIISLNVLYAAIKHLLFKFNKIFNKMRKLNDHDYNMMILFDNKIFENSALNDHFFYKFYII